MVKKGNEKGLLHERCLRNIRPNIFEFFPNILFIVIGLSDVEVALKMI